MNIEIREIDIAQAKELSELAIKIYKQYFLHLWHDGGKWYIHRSYHFQTIAEELEDTNNLHFIAYKNNKPVGYLKIKKNEILQDYSTKNCLEIERIYILQEAANLGLGKQLMQIVFDLGKSMKKNIVFLKSMDSSVNSIAFYKKLGFEKCGTLTLPFEQMKEEYRGMFILKKEL